MKTILNKIILGDIVAIYLQDGEHVELTLCPLSLEDKIVLGKSEKADNLIQLKIEGDATSTGFCAGHTNRNSMSVQNLYYKNQVVETREDSITIVTIEENKDGLHAEHILSYDYGKRACSMYVEVENRGENEICLEMLSSFSISYLSPFESDEATNNFKYHRIRSRWSAEGRVESGMIEDLQLEPSWARHGVSVEKFGQIGSMPVRKFFPFVAIEDLKNNVTWATEICAPASWQIEMYRRDEKLCISGGLADFDFGHWKKCLKPSERFVTPKTINTVVQGGLDDACERMIDLHEKSKPFINKPLPSVFNEYCTTWGKPTQENILKILDVIKDKDFDYFVIDAGWYADDKGVWDNTMGDWIINKEFFPDGLEYVVSKIKEAGMKPGIWFELEVIGKYADILKDNKNLLTKNGRVIMSGDRYFWDMRKEETQEYLNEKVIGLLKKYGFEYIKIDYNETIGIGCDGSDSLGQGLYENVLATQAFFKRIHEEIPGIVIELCSSGGHRLEPSFLDCTDMASFSDAHEELEIPVIAANVHRIMRPEKSQIWSVIRKTDTLSRICYSVCATFLGVLCISGEVFDLNNEQWSVIDAGISFYRKISNIIRNGKTIIYGKAQRSYRKLENYQAIFRKSNTSKEAYIVIHSFDENEKIVIELPKDYGIDEVYEVISHNIVIKNGVLEIANMGAYDSLALRLTEK